MVAKVAAGRSTLFDPWWVGRVLTELPRLYTLIAIPVACAASGAVSPSTRIAAIACTGWAVLHAVAYSIVNRHDSTRYLRYGPPAVPHLYVVRCLRAARISHSPFRYQGVAAGHRDQGAR